MGGKVAIKEKVRSREGERSRASRKPAPPSSTARPPVSKTAGKPGGGARVQVRPKPKLTRVRPPSPEQRLVAAFRRMYRNTVAYFRETRLEMRKVVWPSRRETAVYTLVVVAATAIVGLVIWVFDVGLSALLGVIIR